jgi:hypothetical protein
MVTSGERWIYYSQLKQWGPILTTPGVHFINLQYDNCGEELRQAESLFGVRVQVWDDVDLKDDQETVAALISGLDLVISAGTAVDALAGALGAPAWAVYRGTTAWWGLGTGHCPWYPSVRGFSGGAMEPWEPLLEKVASELSVLAASGPSPRAARVA